MHNYLELLKDVRANGVPKGDRTGVGIYSVFGRQLRFDLNAGFPLMTTKKLFTHSIIGELLWFLSGSTNIKDLHKYDTHIWDAWADATGELGPVYGKQWRAWPNPDGTTIDQISQVLHEIKTNPYSRRMLVVAWNPSDLSKMALTPCHCLFQFYVANNRLSCQLYQRSADIFLGVPFNIASYALLTHMLAQQAGLGVGDFVWTGGDIHLYQNHLEQCEEQLRRTPKVLPQLKIGRLPSDLFSYRPEDFVFEGYSPDPYIRAPIAI